MDVCFYKIENILNLLLIKLRAFNLNGDKQENNSNGLLLVSESLDKLKIVFVEAKDQSSGLSMKI